MEMFAFGTVFGIIFATIFIGLIKVNKGDQSDDDKRGV